MKNAGSIPICFVQANSAYTGTTGVVLWTDKAYADAPPYLASDNQPLPCLAPGESGGFWTNDTRSSPMLAESIASLAVAFDALESSGTPFVRTMTTNIVEDDFYRDGNHWGMSGTYTPSQTVDSISIAVYMKATSGLLLERLLDTRLNAVPANTSWAFELPESVSDSAIMSSNANPRSTWSELPLASPSSKDF